MRRRSLAMIAMAGCGLFPDTSGLSGGVDGAPADASVDAPLVDAPTEASAEDVAVDAPPVAPHVVAVWNNLDNTDAPVQSLTVPIANAAGDALLACVREGTNDTDAFTVGDDKSQIWTQTKSGYESVNVSSRMSCFWVAKSTAVGSVTVTFTTVGGAARCSMTVLDVAGADASSFEDGSVGIGATRDGVTSSLPSGTLSTTHGNDLLVYYAGLGDDVTTWIAGTGFAIPSNDVTPGLSGSNARTVIQVESVSSIQTDVTTSISWMPTIAAGHGEMGLFLAIRGG
ncbi:MAG TPA: hypothetical protein VGH28_22065 [Polyangiaceae bacterium]|jgi:hypothetical protein